MSSCQCCLKPHPIHLIERHTSSIQTIKLLSKNCSIFETILLDEYEHIQKLISNINKYLMQYGTISNQIYSYLSQFNIQLNNRLELLTKYLYEMECLITKCSIWLKTNTIKQISSQLKSYKKQFHSFEKLFIEQTQQKFFYKTKHSKDFSIFQTNYHKLCLQMDLIEYEHMKLFFSSIQLFSSIISLKNTEKLSLSTMNIEQIIKEWKEKHQFHMTWMPNEHNQKENIEKRLEKHSSDIEIKAIDDSHSNEKQDKYIHESNLSWSFTIVKPKEDFIIPSPTHLLSIDKSQSSQSISSNIIPSQSINRVRLAIKAIEQNSKEFPRGRKS